MNHTVYAHGMRRARRRQRGVAAIEFAIVAIVFFTLFFGILELARAMYICNTLQEVTRRAAALAANTDFTNSTAMQQVRQHAIFRDAPGVLVFADPVTDQHVKIDYLQLPAGTTVPVSMAGALPASPAENRANCTGNPNAANCIALVRVRICAPGGASDTCAPVPYRAMVSVVPMSFALPASTTIAKIESLGMAFGTP